MCRSILPIPGNLAVMQVVMLPGWVLWPLLQDTQNLTYPNLAKIKTTEVKFDPASNGYIVTLNLTYQGKLTAPLTKSIVGKLNYIQKRVSIWYFSRIRCIWPAIKVPVQLPGFWYYQYQISDKIDIECNMNFNNK